MEWVKMKPVGATRDILIAEGKTTPFIIVMENSGGGMRGPRPVAGTPGQVVPQGTSVQVTPAGNANTPGNSAPVARVGINFAGPFERILIDDLIPYIESNYRVIADQSHRAMAGLSMGGMQTKSIVIANPTLFSYVGMFSSGTISPTEITDMNSFKKKVKVVFMSFGGREGGATKIPGAAEEWNAAGIKGVSYVSPETAHEWQSWRRSLHEFAGLIFK